MTIQKLTKQTEEIVAEILRDVSGVNALRYYADKFLSLDGLLIEVVCPKCNGSGSWYQPDIEPYNSCDMCNEKGSIIIPTKDLVKK